MSPGRALSQVRNNNPLQRGAEVALRPLMATIRSLVFSPAVSAGLSLRTFQISTPAEEYDSSIPTSTRGIWRM